MNLAVCDRRLAARLDQDFAADLKEATEIGYDAWKNCSLLERAPELIGRLLERQQ